jgi:hypothetical protein
MSLSSILLLLIPPALPPGGPISGSFECLLAGSDGEYSATFSFREDAPLTEVLPMFGEREAYQASLNQFPVDASRIASVEFEGGATITIRDSRRNILGLFSPIKNLVGGARWAEFASPGLNGDLVAHGKCLGNIAGRVERPIILTRVQTFRIDKVSP